MLNCSVFHGPVTTCGCVALVRWLVFYLFVATFTSMWMFQTTKHIRLNGDNKSNHGH